MTNMATCLYSEVPWGEGRAGGDDLNMKPVGRIKETVGRRRRMKPDVIGYVT